jgi:hypothetical protein
VRRREDVERVKGGWEIVVVYDDEIGAVQAQLQALNVTPRAHCRNHFFVAPEARSRRANR